MPFYIMSTTSSSLVSPRLLASQQHSVPYVGQGLPQEEAMYISTFVQVPLNTGIDTRDDHHSATIPRPFSELISPRKLAHAMTSKNIRLHHKMLLQRIQGTFVPLL